MLRRIFEYAPNTEVSRVCMRWWKASFRLPATFYHRRLQQQHLLNLSTGSVVERLPWAPPDKQLLAQDGLHACWRREKERLLLLACLHPVAHVVARVELPLEGEVEVRMQHEVVLVWQRESAFAMVLEKASGRVLGRKESLRGREAGAALVEGVADCSVTYLHEVQLVRPGVLALVVRYKTAHGKFARDPYTRLTLTSYELEPLEQQLPEAEMRSWSNARRPRLMAWHPPLGHDCFLVVGEGGSALPSPAGHDLLRNDHDVWVGEKSVRAHERHLRLDGASSSGIWDVVQPECFMTPEGCVYSLRDPEQQLLDDTFTEDVHPHDRLGLLSDEHTLQPVARVHRQRKQGSKVRLYFDPLQQPDLDAFRVTLNARYKGQEGVLHLSTIDVVASQGRIYMAPAHVAEGEQLCCGVLCVDMEGEEVWHTPLTEERCRCGQDDRSWRLYVHHDMLVAFSGPKTMFAMRASTGELLVTHELGAASKCAIF